MKKKSIKIRNLNFYKSCKNLLDFLFSIFFSINTYGGIFNETVCFETDGQNIVFLPNDTNPYTGIVLGSQTNMRLYRAGAATASQTGDFTANSYIELVGSYKTDL